MMCMTELHGGVCHRTSTPHKSGNKMKEKKKNIKPRNALPVMLDCSQYGGSRFKRYRRCHVLCVQEVIAKFVGSKTSYLIQRTGPIGASPSDT